MKNYGIKTKFVVILSSLLYKIIGGGPSSILAHSWFGKIAYQIISGPTTQFKIFSTNEGIKVKLNAQEALTLGIVYLGTINKYETKILKTIIKPGDIVIDVGTYVDGWYTLLAAKLTGNKGHVYAFEPHPIYYQRLKENVQLNRLTNVTLERLGIFNKSGSFVFYEAQFGSTIIKSQAVAITKTKQPKEITIQATTLDSYVKAKNIRHVSLIKIDVEGAEMSVLKGGNRLLRSKNAPDLVVEVFDKQLRHGGSSEAKLLSYLKRLSYTPYMFTANGLSPYEKEQHSTLNLFFSKKSH